MHASMCGCVNVWVPTCSGADKLQNQGPAGDNTRSTGQKVPEEKKPIKTHNIKPQTQKILIKECRHGYREHNAILRVFFYEFLEGNLLVIIPI